jgi:hypothetical protein
MSAVWDETDSNAGKEPRVATILAPLDPVDRLEEQWRRKHLRMVEKRAMK